MPTNIPTGFETYIYDHKQFFSNYDDRQYNRSDPKKLPFPEKHQDNFPFIMIEPCYASGSNNVWVHFRDEYSTLLSRDIAEQLRDALIRACQKPMIS